MEIRIEQQYFKRQFEYKVFEEKDLIYRGIKNRLFLPGYSKIRLEDLNGSILWEMKQKDLMKLICSYIPPLCWIEALSCPYVIYRHDGLEGHLRQTNRIKEGNAIAEIGNDCIKINLHSDQKYSILRNEIQVALIEKTD